MMRLRSKELRSRIQTFKTFDDTALGT